VNVRVATKMFSRGLLCGWRTASNGSHERAGIAPSTSFRLYAIERNRGNPAMVRDQPQLFRAMGVEIWTARPRASRWRPSLVAGPRDSRAGRIRSLGPDSAAVPGRIHRRGAKMPLIRRVQELTFAAEEGDRRTQTSFSLGTTVAVTDPGRPIMNSAGTSTAF